MDNVESAIKFVTPNFFMVSKDLKDAYYSVPIFKGLRIFFKSGKANCFNTLAMHKIIPPRPGYSLK